MKEKLLMRSPSGQPMKLDSITVKGIKCNLQRILEVMCFNDLFHFVLFLFSETLHELDKLGDTDVLLGLFSPKQLNHPKLTHRAPCLLQYPL